MYHPEIFNIAPAFFFLAPALIPLVGLALSAVGVGVSAYSAVQSAEASQDAERARKQQMQLDANRRRRESIRESMLAQGQALNAAAAQGASEGSAVKGATAAISGNAAESIVNTNQNVALGNQIYDANGRRAGWEGIGSIGQGVQSWGSMITNNSDKIAKLPSGLKGLFDPYAET